MITLRVKEIIKQQGTTMAVEAKNTCISATALGVEPFELFVTREELEKERKRRMARLVVPSATVVCPCCGGVIHVMLGD